MSRNLCLGLLFGLGAAAVLPAWGQSATWTNNGSGNWSDTFQWQPSVADGADSTATFRPNTATTINVTVDTSRTIGYLVANQKASYKTTTIQTNGVDGSGLTLQTTAPAVPRITSLVSANLVIDSPLHGTQGVEILTSQTGADGPLTLSSTLSDYSGDTVVLGGRLRLAASSAAYPVIAGPVGTGRLVLKNGAQLSAHNSSGGRDIYNEVVLDGDVVIGNGTDYATLYFRGPITLTGNRTWYGPSPNTTYVIGAITGTPYKLTLTGSRQLYMCGQATYGGGTIVNGTWSGSVALQVASDTIDDPPSSGPFGTGELRLVSGSFCTSGAVNRTISNPVFLDGDAIQLGMDTTHYGVLTFTRPLALTGNRVLTEAHNASWWSYLKGGATDNDGGYQLSLRGGRRLLFGGTNTLAGIRLWDAHLTVVPGSTWNAPISLVDNSSYLRLENSGATNTALSEVIFGYASPYLWLNENAATSSTWTASRLTRAGRAVLIVGGENGTTLGPPSVLTAKDKFLVTAAPTVANGMVAPYLIEVTGDFLTYDPLTTGLKRVAYDPSVNINTAGSTAIYNATNAQTLTDNREVHALRVTTSIAGAFDLTVGSGGISAPSGSPVIGCNLQLGTNEAVVVNAVTLPILGTIGGSGGLTKAGAGMLALSNANLYTGPMTVHAGSLRLGATGALPAGQPLALNQGTIELNGQSIAPSTFYMAGGVLTNSGGSSATLATPRIVYNGTYRGAQLLTGPATNVMITPAGAAVFDVADGYAGDDLYCSAGVTSSVGLVKLGAGTLFLDTVDNQATLSGTLYVMRGLLRGRGAPGYVNSLGAQGMDVQLAGSGGIYQMPRSGNPSYTNNALSFSGGNSIRLNGMQTAQYWYVNTLGRTAGSRGTLLVCGSYTGTGYYDYFGNGVNYKLRVPQWSAGLAHMPAYCVQVRAPTDPANDEGSHLRYLGGSDYTVHNLTYTTGDINAYGSGTDYSVTGNETLTADRSVYSVRTLANLLGPSRTLTVAGDTTNQAGFIVNANCTIEPLVKFGASGNLEGCVFVRNNMTGVFTGGVSTAVGLTKFGPGTLRLPTDNSATYTGGGTFIQGGQIEIGNAAALGPASNPVFIQHEASLELLNSFTLNHAISGPGTIVTGTNVLTLGSSGSLSPGDASNAWLRVNTLAVDRLDFRGTYYWDFDGTNTDVIAAKVLTFGGAPKLVCNWLGTGAVPRGTTQTLFTYTGADPTLPTWSVTPPPGGTATVSVDSAGKRVVLTISKGAAGSLLLFR